MRLKDVAVTISFVIITTCALLGFIATPPTESSESPEPSASASRNFPLLSSEVLSVSKDEWMNQQREFFLLNGGFGNNFFAKKHVVHLGCGPRPRSTAMKDAIVTCVEPLADFYISNINKRRVNGEGENLSLELEDVSRVYSTPPEKRIDELLASADIVLITIDRGSGLTRNLGSILKTAGTYLKADTTAFVYVIVSLNSPEQGQVAAHTMIESIFSLGMALHKGVSAASMIFEQGACVLPRQNRTDLTFNSCYFILRKVRFKP